MSSFRARSPLARTAPSSLRGGPLYFPVSLTEPAVGNISTGESRKHGLRWQKCRHHRHRTRPPGLDGCGRGARGVAATLRRAPRLGPESQQQVIDAVQLDVEVLELGVKIFPVRQRALGAERGVDLGDGPAAVDLRDDA